MSVDAFIEHMELESKLAPRSVRAYRMDLVQYDHWLRSKGYALRSAHSSELQSYLDHLESLGRRPTSIRRSASAISRYYKFRGQPLQRNEVARPKQDGESTVFGRALTKRQLDGIRAAVKGERAVDSRNTAAVEALYGLGLRVSELVSLDLADVSFTKGVVRTVGKHGERRVMPLGGYAAQALEQWIKHDRKKYARERGIDATFSPAVFINREGIRITRQAVSRMIDAAAKKANLTGTIAPHMIRDTCARHMMRNGASRDDVDALFGHIAIVGSPKVSWAEVDRLRLLLERAHPAWHRGPGK